MNAAIRSIPSRTRPRKHSHKTGECIAGLFGTVVSQRNTFPYLEMSLQYNTDAPYMELRSQTKKRPRIPRVPDAVTRPRVTRRKTPSHRPAVPAVPAAPAVPSIFEQLRHGALDKLPTYTSQDIQDHFHTIENGGRTGIYSVLAQALGTDTDAATVRHALCDDDPRACTASTATQDILRLAADKFVFHAVLLQEQDVKGTFAVVWRRVNSRTNPPAPWVYVQMRKGRNQARYNLLVEKVPRVNMTDDTEREYHIQVVGWKSTDLRRKRNLDYLRFEVHYDGYDDQYNEWHTFDHLLDNAIFHQYIESATLRNDARADPWRDDAIARIQAFRQQPDDVDDDPLPVKGNTGRKLTVVGDQLKLRGKGGIYAFLPYDKVDKKNKGIFKIGMTLEFKRRFEQVHSYFPEGVYLVNILSNPDVPAWTKKQHQAWEATHDSKVTATTMKDMLYKQMEAFVFDHVEKHGAVRIHRTTRVRQPNQDGEGITEWVYTDEDTIHNAFLAASKAFPGGHLQTFYLSGIDPNTLETVKSINDLADTKAAQDLPNFTGKIIFKL